MIFAAQAEYDELSIGVIAKKSKEAIVFASDIRGLRGE